MNKLEQGIGASLGADHATQTAALKETQAEIFTWVVRMIGQGESLYSCAKALGMHRGALERKLQRAGIDYQPKPGGPAKR